MKFRFRERKEGETEYEPDCQEQRASPGQFVQFPTEGNSRERRR